MTTEDDFQGELDARPGDAVLRLVFADWLEERGDWRALGYRYLGVRCRRPDHRADQIPTPPYLCSWYRSGTGVWFTTTTARSVLPRRLFDQLPTGLGGARSYASRREAEEAVCRVLHSSPSCVRYDRHIHS